MLTVLMIASTGPMQKLNKQNISTNQIK